MYSGALQRGGVKNSCQSLKYHFVGAQNISLIYKITHTLCVWACMCVCGWEYTHWCVHAHVCTWRPEVNLRCHSSGAFHLLHKIGSLISPDLDQVLAGQWAPSIPQPLWPSLPSLGLYVCAIILGFLQGLLGSKLSSSHLWSKCLTHLPWPPHAPY